MERKVLEEGKTALFNCSIHRPASRNRGRESGCGARPFPVSGSCTQARCVRTDSVSEGRCHAARDSVPVRAKERPGGGCPHRGLVCATSPQDNSLFATLK